MRLSQIVFVALLLVGSTKVADAQRVQRVAVKAKKVAKQPQRAAKPRTARAPAGLKAKTNKTLTPKAVVARTKKLATEYTKANNLGEPRVITMGPAGRQVDRVFVPVLAESQEAFQTKFSASGTNGTVIVRHTPQNMHVALIAEPGDAYLWGLNHNGKDGNSADYTHLYAQVDGTRSTWAGTSIVIHPTSIKSLTDYLTSNKERGTKCEGHCMVWLPSAPTGTKGETLFTDMGIKRSKEGNNIKAKIVHAGNHRVGVIGIHVTSLQQFKDMTNEQLQGPAPDKGVEQAAIQ